MHFSKANYVNDIFNDQIFRSKKVSERVAASWYQFSKFVPCFLSKLCESISDNRTKKRIESIISEELGEGIEGSDHAILYKMALNKAGININEKKVEAIENYFRVYSENLAVIGDRESFVIGLSYGLEIIAEENIAYLLKYSSFDSESEELLAKTAFFIIHAENEIEHIRKCEESAELLKKDATRKESFDEGVKVSLNFWKHFWIEATSSETSSSEVSA